LKATKPKKKPNLIGLENVHIIDEPIPELLRICNKNEPFFQNNIKKTLNNIIKHFRDSHISFKIFDQFKPVLSGNILQRVKKYIEKKTVDLGNYARFFRLLRKYDELWWKIPKNLYFPLFDVSCNQVK